MIEEKIFYTLFERNKKYIEKNLEYLFKYKNEACYCKINSTLKKDL